MKHIKLWPLHAIIVSPINGGFNMATLLNPTGHEVFYHQSFIALVRDSCCWSRLTRSYARSNYSLDSDYQHLGPSSLYKAWIQCMVS